MKYKFGNSEYILSERTFIMGILNVTPDSFSDGGKYFKNSKPDLDKILSDATRMEHEGADFIDIGGESTRPGAEKVSVAEEMDRVIPVIAILSKKIKIPISIDSYKSEVVEEAFKNGAEIANDISGLTFDDRMVDVIARYNKSCILMHIKGTPDNMQENPQYNDVVKEVYSFLHNAKEKAENYGIKQIILDVGIGFGKTLEHNILLINNLSKFKELNCPLLIGLSNKSFIDKISPTPINERLGGTIAANVVAILHGVNILRVHNVLDNRNAAIVTDYLKKYGRK
ncbi:MAG: dihydropteroate synthase [Ignavibacteria bacterium]|nr:dihydropteroate synthase [Ignavibacteria bacterium]